MEIFTIKIFHTKDMGKIRVGNKQNSFLNGEWSRVKKGWKKVTSGLRRALSKRIIKDELNQ